MRVYAIKDDTIEKNYTIAYLFYYPRQNASCIEICEDIDEWNLPFVLEHFVRRGIYSISSSDTLTWINQRIVPPDRQNIATILNDCGLEEYDPYQLLFISDGKCAQDDCYIEMIKETDIPIEIKKRRKKNISEIVITNGTDLLLTFNDEKVALIELNECKKDYSWLELYLNHYDRIKNFKLMAGGSSVFWDDKREISFEYLYNNSKMLPIDASAIRNFAEQQIVSTTEVMEILDCTRQNVDDLVKRGRLKPLDIKAKSKMFLRKDVLSI